VAEANNSSDDTNLVYLIELDDVSSSDEWAIDPGAFPPRALFLRVLPCRRPRVAEHSRRLLEIGLKATPK
jgi:hypothetical protein